MSLSKRLLEKQMERGFGEVPDKKVCFRCVGDKGLSLYIGRRACFKTCDYCGNDGKNNISISLEELITHIQKSLRSEYKEPYDAGAIFDDETREWQVDVHDGYDMVHDVECIEDADEKLLKDISDVLLDNSYCLPRDSDEYIFLSIEWEEFTDMIKHRSRFMFYHPQCSLLKKEKDKYRDILKIVGKFIIDKRLIIEIDPTQAIKRVRLYPKPISVKQLSAKNLGTVPEKSACLDNRMSPAGISMFYGSDDLKTAVQEVYVKDKNYYGLGRFVPSRKIYLVDFTKKIDVPSIYDEKLGKQRWLYSFMVNFIDSLAQPIIKDKKEDIINYVPTQVIAEYIRYVLNYNGKKIDGLIYKSSIPKCGNCYALFVDNEHCISLGEEQNPDELYLILTEQEHGGVSDVVPAEELRTTNSEPSEPV